MEDNKKTQGVETPNTPEKEENKGGKAFTQEDLDNLAGKVRREEQEKQKTAIENAVNNAIAEYERKAKLSEEEREKEAKTKREAELKAREDEITLRERKISAQEMLRDKNVPTALAEFIIDLDEKKTNENIEKLVKIYAKSVEDGVTDKLKGNPPTDFSQDNKTTDDKKKVSSAF